MRGKRIAVLESGLGTHLVELITRAGGVPLHAPALAELREIDPDRLAVFLDHCVHDPPGLFVFQTGRGAQVLLDAVDQLGREAMLLDLLAHAKVAARGPKPAGVLSTHGIRIDFLTAEPHTTAELLNMLAPVLRPQLRAVIQRHGESNRWLQAMLHAHGVEIVELPSYRWVLPADTAPLVRLLDALDARTLDAAVFTSASQARNLFFFARQMQREATLRTGLQDVMVVSIGPVCSAALRSLGVSVAAEASPPRLGPLRALLEQRLG